MLPSGRFRVLWCLGRSAPWRAHWSASQLDRRFRIRGAFIDRAIRVSRAGPLTRPRTRPRTRTPTLPPTLNRRRVVKLPVRRPQQHRLRRHDRPPLPRRLPRCRRCRRWNRSQKDARRERVLLRASSRSKLYWCGTDAGGRGGDCAGRVEGAVLAAAAERDRPRGTPSTDSRYDVSSQAVLELVA